jgi:hypothetical protein
VPHCDLGICSEHLLRNTARQAVSPYVRAHDFLPTHESMGARIGQNRLGLINPIGVGFIGPIASASTVAITTLQQHVLDEVPWSDHVTDYDRAHFDEYIRLLDADADGASLEVKARHILLIDPIKEPERARRAVESHTRRAEWMTEVGYRDLLHS